MSQQRHYALTGLAKAAIVLLVTLSMGALGGGVALILGPRGEILPLPVSQLQGSPFDSYFGPGLILFMVLGLGPLVVAILAWWRRLWAPFLNLGVAAALLLWMAVEIAIVGYSDNPPLQPIYIVLGLVMGAVGVAWLRQTGSPFRMRLTART